MLTVCKPKIWLYPQPTSLSNYARTIFTPLKVDNFTLSEIHFDTTASSCSPESRHAFSGCYCGHWSGHSGIHILRTYSLVHLVVAKLEELYFLDVTGSIQDPIAVPGPCEVTEF